MTTEVLAACLDLALEARLDEASGRLAEELAASRDPARRVRVAAVAAFAAVIAADYRGARTFSALATAAASRAGEPSAREYAAAITTFVECLAPPDGRRALAPARGNDPSPGSAEDASVFGYVAIEAAMSAGRLGEAEVLALSYLANPGTASRQAPIFAGIALARALVFQGRVGEAAVAIAAASRSADARGGRPARMLAAAAAAYIAAQAGDREQTERLTGVVVALDPDPRNYLTVGSHVLCAYGLAAVGNLPRAAAMLLQAGGGPALPRLQTVDRAYGYEILAAEAIDRRDVSGARSWGRRAAPLQIHDMAAAAVERTLSRIDVATGHTASGAERAAISAARALVAGGRLDAARSRVLEASALAAIGAKDAAVAGFRIAVVEATTLGAIAVRNWSARELRRLQRRAAPAVGAGWEVLSAREQQVALLAAEGFSNRMIGQALFLSERTVQSHLSRVLAALGAPSRSALPARLGRGPVADSLPGLTERQQEVALLVAQGCPNRVIATSLGISDKTVEKHVQAIFARWGVASRTAIANRVLAPLGSDRSPVTG